MTYLVLVMLVAPSNEKVTSLPSMVTVNVAPLSYLTVAVVAGDRCGQDFLVGGRGGAFEERQFEFEITHRSAIDLDALVAQGKRDCRPGRVEAETDNQGDDGGNYFGFHNEENEGSSG